MHERKLRAKHMIVKVQYVCHVAGTDMANTTGLNIQVHNILLFTFRFPYLREKTICNFLRNTEVSLVPPSLRLLVSTHYSSTPKNIK